MFGHGMRCLGKYLTECHKTSYKLNKIKRPSYKLHRALVVKPVMELWAGVLANATKSPVSAHNT